MNDNLSRLRKAGIGLSTAALMLTALLAAPSSANADDDPSVLYGNVTGFGNVVLADGVDVSIYDSTHALVDDVQADTSTGDWTSDLELNSGMDYSVEFTPVSTHYRAGEVDGVTVPTDGSPINEVLDNKGAATGQVVDGNGTGIPNVTVDLLSTDGNMTVDYTGTTDSDGNYAIWADNDQQGESGSYLIRYSTPDASYQTEYSGQNNGETTDPNNNESYVSIADDQVPLPTITMTPATSITGTITYPNGNPIVGATVSAYDVAGVLPTSSDVTTDPNGDYTITGLGHADYNLQVSYPGYFYEGSATLDADLTTASTTEVDASLDEDADIQGTVTDAVTGDAVEGVDVTVLGADGTAVSGATTDSTGHYAVYELPFGDYTVEFTPADPNTASYLDQTSGSVSVTAENYDATENHSMVVGGSISGTITTLNDSSNSPEEVIVTATSTTSSFNQYVFVTPTKAGVATPYTIAGLPDDTYTVEFDPQDDNTFASQWWSGAYSADKATPITVSATHSAVGISDTVKKNVQPAGLYVKVPYADHIDVGQTLSVAIHSHTASVPSKVTSTYQWFRVSSDNSVPDANIPKATKSSYTATNADAGYYIGVNVTQTASGYAPTTTSIVNEGGAVGNAIFTTVPKFALSGTASTGHTLTVASKGTFSVPVTLNYYWSMNGLRVPSSWSTQTTLVDPTDVNAATSSMLLGWDDLGHGNPYDSEEGSNPDVSWLTDQGDVNYPEDVSNMAYTPGSHDYPFEFSQLLQPQWNGQRLAVQVCAQDLNGLYKEYCKTLKVTIAHDLIKRLIPVVTQNGNGFTAAAGIWHSSTYLKGTVGLKYQWYANNGTTNTPISGATKSSFTSTAAQSGDVITVHVTGSASGYTSATTYSLDTYTAP